MTVGQAASLSFLAGVTALCTQASQLLFVIQE